MKITIRRDEKGLVNYIDKSAAPGWLDVGKPPTLPGSFQPIVHNYTNGQPVSKDIKVIPISGQQWLNLTQNEQEQLLELVEWLGVTAEDYCRQFQSMLPRDPDRRNR